MNNENKNNYIVIMAGGIGSRFWPESRVSRPKQFIDVLNTGKTLIQSTFDRFANLVPKENIFVVTSQIYTDEVIKQLPDIPKENILEEPERKNTAPCIGYACYKIGKLNPNANILISPADHIIIGDEKFKNIVNNSFDYVTKNEELVTIGIKPTNPSTGYGYIQFVEDENSQFKKVKTFTEKPQLEIAKEFLKSGDFLWNAGIFVWSFQTFKKNFEAHLPDMATLFDKIYPDLNTPAETQSIQNAYSLFNNISIDYGLMEKAEHVAVIPADFEWSDLGTWSSIYEELEKDYLGNAVIGDMVKIYDSSNNLIVAPHDKLVVVEGLSNMYVIETQDVLMIISKDKEQEVKTITTDLKREKLDKFL